MNILISVSAPQKFYYGLKFRPYSIGAQPTNPQPVEFIDAEKAAKDKRFAGIRDSRNYRHGILAYPKELPERDVKSFELVDLNTPDEDKLWSQFLEFVEDSVEYEIEFDDFVKDYIHPRGTARDSNPLHEMKPVDFFNLLKRKGYPGKMEGLKRLYETI